MGSMTSSTAELVAAPLPASAAVAELTEVEHVYGAGARAVTAVGPVSLRVDAGEFVVLIGASGCGKSTLLRLIAGFEHPSRGAVSVNGNAPVPGRGLGVVFQQPRLLPWRTVAGNVDLALRLGGVAKSERARRREGLLHRVGLDDTSDRRVWELSGGQQQRVALARALATDPALLLLDEPFAALDALTRERLQEDLRSVSSGTGRAAVLVTHSVDEAVFLGSRVVVLSARPGRIVLDRRIPLPRTGVHPDELRGSPEYAALRAQLSAAVRTAATPTPAQKETS
jgi:taurine transport system ATP-binding protein